MRRLSTTIRVFSFSVLLVSQLARAERLPTAVLWLDGGTSELVSAIDAQLGSSKALSPLDDLEAKKSLVVGGATGRVNIRFASGKEHFAALELPQANADLAEAETIAIAELRVADACEKLRPIERLRLRYAELQHDEPAAIHAAMLLAACTRSSSPPSLPEDAEAIKRHPAPPPAAGAKSQLAVQSSVRIETEPPGAAVFLDLQEIGKTPLVLSPNRAASAQLDIELPGYRKLHRPAPESGTLTIALSRDDRLAELVDRIRASDGNAPDSQLADLGRRIGAARLIVLRRDMEKPSAAGPAATTRGVQGRVLDVNASRWIGAPELISGATAIEIATRVVAWASGEIAAAPVAANASTASPPVAAPPTTSAAAAAPAAKPAPPVSLANKVDHVVAHAPALVPVQRGATDKPAWKKWYTWAIGGALVAVIGAFLIAQQIGDDQVTVHVDH